MAQTIGIITKREQAAVVSHPLRARILNALRDPGSATTVADALGLPRQKVNYHVRQLEERGLVEHVEGRKRRGLTERIVRATARHYLIAPSVLGELEARPERARDRTSSAYLAAVSARTISEVAELRNRADAAGKKLPTFTLETAVRFRSATEQSAFLEELANTVAALVSRYHDAEAGRGRWFRFVVGSHPALRAPDETHENDDHGDMHD